MHSAYRYRLEPTLEQRKQFAQFAGCSRRVWNDLLAEQQRRYEAGEKHMGFAEMSRMITSYRLAPETPWLRECHVHVLQQRAADMEKSYQAFFKALKEGRTDVGLPQFKNKYKKDSFRYSSGIVVNNGRVKLPKIGWVKFRNSRNIPAGATIGQTTIRRDGAHWFVSISFSTPDVDKPVHTGPAVGIDLGVVRFATLSTGEYIEPPQFFKKIEKTLARAQKDLARKQKGSNNRKKQKFKVAKLRVKEADARKDFLHKASTAIATQFGIVAMEDLDIKQMTKSAAGTIEAPGKCVQRKSSLNKAILDCGWGMFRGFIEYKLLANGGLFVKVDPAWTSQMCYACKHCCPENRRKQALFLCVACGHTTNADNNAALNILAAGLAVIACGEASPRKPPKEIRKKFSWRKKQEPPGASSAQAL